MNHRSRIGVALLVLGTATSAPAQVRQSKWEVEVHGGTVRSTTSEDGTGALPVPGPTVGNVRPVPSWYFGDGTSQLNRLASRTGPQIVPLDSLLQRRFVERQSGGSVGVRLSRTLTRRLAAELTVDDHLGTLAVTSGSATALEATRASFASAWNSVLTFGPIATRSATSELTLSDRRGRQLVTAGTLLVGLTPSARLAPYLAVGAGVISNRETPPSASLAGAYQFTLIVPPTPGLRQTDTVTIRSAVDGGRVWVLGGGFKYGMSDRWGVRFDVRDHLRGTTTTTLLDATPATTPLPSFGALAIFIDASAPVLAFSGPGASPPSTLSAAPLTGFKTFAGSGTEHHVNITGGLYWRF